ncbi:GNAT family N-acetyltransferase [Chryseobacterium balustinum]|jgi:ribosomal protein S18 acetylase RimI-like enzyme|uniref:Ribosomal protein S18 acetylase RimI n=1 Tax=Chryseobacterium balustinum TaxID=246 RepID=A0AAX2ILH2_9FLAO|nr:GNAT family N-acetyltransferase [Chryseobacterium balustinum]AZB29625.1 GNAT family N-acetyltransferase [Chryseobacterium balustinum]SKB88299.1 Ribosomal protein S18 acetylase RimI [Chryseobacterium balustinum]SQA89972.1 ribosomal-protein-alanine acetyltransferase [Chryseobacterium balustinum]
MLIEYRSLLPDESKEYRRIRLESLKEFPEAFSATYQETLNVEKLTLEDDIEKQTFNKFVHGVFVNRELIGICTFVKSDENIGNIYQMYVQKGFQGKNIGLNLVHSTIKEAAKRYHDLEIFLEVSVDNLQAKHFYLKAGFEQIRQNENSSDILMKYRSF